MARLEKMREAWSPGVEFTYIYIKEAHPDDDRQAEKNILAGVVFADPETFDERMHLARTFVTAMDVGTRTLVDDMTNIANACYAAWPERIYVIGRGGRIAYKGGMGPFLFDPDELEAFLEETYSQLRTGSGEATGG